MRTHVSRTVSSCFAVYASCAASVCVASNTTVAGHLAGTVSVTRLDYGNTTLAGLPGNQLDKLQSVINAAARLVCSARKYEHITPLPRDLHWLPVRERIEFKLAVLVFRCLHGTTLPYLANELCRVAVIDARRRLCFASTSPLVTPSSRRSTIGDRAFFVAAPRVWNSLPSSVTASQTLGTFRRRLKTHLFAVSLT